MLLTVLQRTIDDFITFKDFFLHFTLVLKFFENWTSTLFIRIKSSEPNLCFSLLLIALWFKCPFSAICGDWISILYIWPTLSPRLLLSPYFVKRTKSESKHSRIKTSLQKTSDITSVFLFFIDSTLVQMSLLSHLWRLNFHPLHLAHFVAVAFALSLFRQNNCYFLAEKTSEKRRVADLFNLWSNDNDTWQYQWQQSLAEGGEPTDISQNM